MKAFGCTRGDDQPPYWDRLGKSNPQRRASDSSWFTIAREKGVAACIGAGANRWAAAHVSDVARLFALVLDRGASGLRYHAVAEQGVTMQEIAGAVAAGLGVPTVSLTKEEAGQHFGWFAMFAQMDMPASSTVTRERLGWQPSGLDLLTDLRQMNYGG
ncbi:hypothetical protein D2T33_21030 [Sinirhodobacter populi]|uniref:NAD-dependent epimerase/dehydratase family protein n=1 Tax=Paenirhodobacter populi TaxID=2306993 RepID=A0A443IJT1_9RHOB|nr:hypothetical protein D2T33_21030 [Sinirhodobacter populi]